MIRSTLGGVSSVTDPYGQKVIPDSKIGQPEIQLISLPIFSVETFFTKWGNLTMIAICILSFLVGILNNPTKDRGNKS